MADSLYARLAKSGWLGDQPRITQELDEKTANQNAGNYGVIDSTPTMVGKAIQRLRQKNQTQGDDNG